MMHRLWNNERATITRGHAGTTCYHAEEELVFVCERYDGSDLPIDGTEEQIQQLPVPLSNGKLTMPDPLLRPT